MTMSNILGISPEQALKCLQESRILHGLPDELLQEIVRVSEVRPVALGKTLFQQGRQDEDGMAVFIVLSGEIIEQRVEDDRVVFRRTARTGDVLGFRGILEGGIRLSSASAQTVSFTLRLPAGELIRLQARYPELRDRLLRLPMARRLRAMPLLGSLSDDQLRWMVDLFVPREFQPGETIIDTSRHRTPAVVAEPDVPPSEPIGDSEPTHPSPDHPDSTLIALGLIDYGQVIAHTGGARHVVLTAGHYFGAHDELGTRRAAIARAVTRVVVYCLDPADLEWLLTTYPGVAKMLKSPPDVIQRMQAAKPFAHLQWAELAALAGYVCWEYHPARTTVTQQGEPGDAFYILNRGIAVVRAVDPQGREYLRNYLEAGAYFGETSLILQEPRDATVESVTSTDWLVLHHDDLVRFLRTHREAWSRLREGLRPETLHKLEAQTRTRRSLSPRSEEEPVLFRVRRHWWVLLSRIALSVIVLLALLFLLGAEISLGGKTEAILAALSSLLAASYMLWVVVDWANDWLILTTTRIIHQERVLLISENRDEAPLTKVQDINIRRDLLGNLIGYGHLVIQTAATIGSIEFHHAANPVAVRQVISDQISRARAGAAAVSRERIRRELEGRLGARLLPATPRSAIQGDEIKSEPSQAGNQPRRRSRRFSLFSTWQEEGDQITWRKHPVNLLMRVAKPAILLTIVLIMGWLAGRLWPTLQGQYEAGTSIVFVLLLLGLIGLAWLLWEYDDWRNDLYIVTRDRIIDIERRPLFFSESRREATLDMIQNVTSDIPNPLAYILRYGNVTIQTAAETGAFNFVYVSQPRRVQEEISRRVEAFRAEQAAREQAGRAAEMAAWFDAYRQLHEPPSASG